MYFCGTLKTVMALTNEFNIKRNRILNAASMLGNFKKRNAKFGLFWKLLIGKKKILTLYNRHEFISPST